MNQNKHTLFAALCRTAALVIASCTILSFAQLIYGNTLIWNGGGGTDGNWGNSANWFGLGTPNNGDSVIFQGATGLNTTNNIANLTLGQIKFLSGGFNIYGSPFTLTNSIVATNFTGTITFSNNITIATADVTLLTSNSITMTLKGNLGGSVGVIKTGQGTVIYNGPNDNAYMGTTLVSGGQLELNVGGANAFEGPLVIGDPASGLSATVLYLQSTEMLDSTPITINLSGTLNLNTFSDTIGTSLVLNGGSISTGTGSLALSPNATITVTNGSTISGNFNTGSGTLTLQGNGTIFFNAVVSGFANIVQNDLVNTSWSGLNTYSGNLTANTAGYVDLHTSQALGNTNNILTLNGQAIVGLEGISITNQAVIINTTNVAFGPFGTIDGFVTTNIWQANFILGSSCTIFPASGVTLRLVGPITGPGGFMQMGGILYLDGPAQNLYLGGTVISNTATLMMNKTFFDGAIPGNLDIKFGGTVRYANNNQITNVGDVFVESGGTFDFATFFDDINTLHGTGNVTFGAFGFLKIGQAGGTSEFDGLMSGIGFTSGYTVGKFGSGTFTMTGNNTFQNGLFIAGGTLLVNGNEPQNPVIYMTNGATLGGSGTIGAITGAAGMAGTVSPGNNGPGILTCSNVTFTSTSTFKVELTGPNPGAGGYDQLNVMGTNTLANATLTVVPAFTTPVAVGQQFIIINNDLSDANIGTFNGLPQGSTITLGNYKFSISYVGGSGNDVVLTLTSTPGAVVASTVTSGDGSHGIDPNGCNNLSLVVSNTTGTAMTGVIATLSTTTEGVVITQPYVTYPNIAASGTATNLTPFQISVLPSFICATPITLQLSINSSIGLSTVSYVLVSGEAAAPSEYDITGNVVIPDVGSVDSTNTVSGFTSLPLKKVTVSLYITHPFDSDLTNISLISPDGISVLLSSANGGSGQNYGAGLTPQSNRTTFDDAAGTAITAGAAPFVGTFRPQSPLAAFTNVLTPNGAWHLHIADGFGGSLGTLRGWSLFLDGTSCSSGSGTCDYCLTTISGLVTNTSPTQTDRISRDTLAASCGAPKAWPGFIGDALTRHCAIYNFVNTSASEACVTAVLTSSGDLQAGIYLNSFNPLNISSNYLADSGDSTEDDINDPQSCSASIPAGATFFVTVDEITPNAGGSYTLQLSGLPCPPPTLNIQPVAPGKARLYWDTSAGGYVLQSVSNLTATAWGVVTNEPMVSGGNYNVTNSIAAPVTNRFYRLQQP
jgi:autotransporter-associated beta strand protein